MAGILHDDCVVSEPGNLNPVRIPLTGISCSWEINAAGSLSAFVRLEDMRAAGLLGNIKGYWLTYPTAAGLWGGVITGQPSTGTYMEIGAQGFLMLLKGRMLTSRLLAMGGSAGGLARRALSQAGAGNPTFIDLGDIDEGGGALSLDLTGDVATDVLPQLADAGDVEWVVTANRVFHLARRLGNDLSSTVRLVEDRHIVNARVNDDLDTTNGGQVYRVQSELSQTVMSRIRTQSGGSGGSGMGGGVIQPPNNPAPPAPPPSPPTPPVVEQYADLLALLAQYGFGIPAGLEAIIASQQSVVAEVWQAQMQTYTLEAPGVASAPSTNAASAPWSGVAIGIGANNPAVAGKRHVPPPTVPVQLDLANTDGCFLAFDLGDTVRIDLGSIGVTGRFRVINKHLDVATQVLEVSGELLKDA